MKIDLEALFLKYDSEPEPIVTQPVEEIITLHQAVENVKAVFPGAKILSEQEVQKMNAKGYFDSSERAEEQIREAGEEG